MAKYFYDCEFLEGTQKKKLFGITIGETKPTIDLISIGIVAEDGREYYAISKDFNLKEAWNRHDIENQIMSVYLRNQYPNGRKQKIYWIRENVLKPIFEELLLKFNEESSKSLKNNNYIGCLPNKKFRYSLLKFLINYYGKTNKDIAEEVRDFTIRKNKLDNEIITSSSDIDYPELYGFYSAYDHVALCWLFGKMLDLPNGFPMYTKDLKQILDEKPLVYKPTVLFKDEKYIGGIDPYYSSWEQHIDYPKQENEHSAIHDARWNKKLYEFLQKI